MHDKITYPFFIIFGISVILIFIWEFIVMRCNKNKALSENKKLDDQVIKLSKIVQQVADVIFITDRSGIIEYVNPAFEQITGYSSQESIGKKCSILNSGMMPKEYYETLWNAIISGKVFHADVINKRKNSELFYYEQTVTPIMDESGVIINFVSTGKDITEKKKAEDELRNHKLHLEQLVEERTEDLRKTNESLKNEIAYRNKMEEDLILSEYRYRILTELSPVGIFNCDAEGNCNYVNDKWCIIAGMSKENALGKGWIEAIHEDDRERIFCQCDECMSGKRDFQLEFRLKTASGNEKWVMGQAIPQTNAEGELTGYIGSLTDITEIKSVQLQLQKAKREEEAANKAKSTFIANMSHEIRTPLNAILGFSQLLYNDDLLNSEQKSKLKIITRSGEHLLSIINDILEISKIEAGAAKLNAITFDLCTLLEDIENMFHIRCADKGLTLKFEKDENLPRYVIQDEKKLRQIFINLIGNSIKFTEKGEIVVSVSCEKADDSAQKIVVKVKDSGMGISEGDINKVFGYFVQSGNSEKIKGGTGIGLTISKEFVNLMGGDISVKSSVGQGTEVTFSILAKQGAEDKIDKNETQDIVSVRLNSTCKILIADDTENERMLLKEILKPVGFQIKEACNGLEVLSICNTWKPDLIFMDIKMPVVNGYEAIRKIRSSKGIENSNIVALTSSAFKEEKDSIFVAGANELIRKPFNINQLFKVIKKYLDVDFVYEHNTNDVKHDANEGDSFDIKKSLKSIPNDMLEQLRMAVIDGDIDLINEILVEIMKYDECLSGYLKKLVDNFEFDKINDFISEPARQHAIVAEDSEASS